MMSVMCVGIPTPELDDVMRPGLAFLPIPVSAATGIKGATLRRARATVFWLHAIPRVNEAQSLVVVGAPNWATPRIRRVRNSGLGASGLQFVATASHAADLLAEIAPELAPPPPDATQN